MGMFDYVICEAVLPDGFDSSNFEFQTKDTEAQHMDTYIITSDGRLMYREWARDEQPPLIDTNFHGDIEFYGSTMCATGPGYYSTEDDKPLVERGYTARFANGQLESIKLDSDENTQPEWKTERKHITRQESHEQFWAKHGRPTKS